MNHIKVAFLFRCIFIFFLCHFLSLILSKCLLARFPRKKTKKKTKKKTSVFATEGGGGSNHSEVIIKGDILLMFGVFVSCIFTGTLSISSCTDLRYYETERLESGMKQIWYTVCTETLIVGGHVPYSDKYCT